MKTLFCFLMLCSVAVSTAQVLCGSSANVTSGCAPLTVSFTNQSTGNITQHYWDFDGMGTSASTNPSQTFFTPGVYTITHIVGNNTEKDTCHLSIRIFEPPVAKFQGIDVTTCINDCNGLNILNTSQSGGAPISTYLWDFGDGSTSNIATAQHCYSSAGLFDLVLVVRDTNGCQSSFVLPDFINVLQGPAASITSSHVGACRVADTVMLSTVNNSSPVTYNWNLGNGNFANTQQVSNIYPYGLYTASLIVTDTNTCKAYDTIMIDMRGIEANIQANATFDPCPPFPVSFSTAGNVAVHQWYFGDGDSSGLSNPIHVYDKPGVYTVSLTVTDSVGICTNTFTKQDFITLRGPQVITTVSEDSGAVPHFITIDATLEDVLTWTITTGDGSVFPNPTFPLSYTYIVEGEYIVTISAENDLGCGYAIDIDTIIVKDTLINSISSYGNTGIRIFPSVADNYIMITTDNTPANANIEIYNALGSRIHTRQFVEGSNSIDVSVLQSGLYFVLLRTNSTIIASSGFMRR